MTEREWLQQVKKLDELIDGKLAEREQLMALATRVTPNMDGMPHGSGGVQDRMGLIVAKLADLAKETDDLVDQYVDYKDKVVKALEQLPEREYAVLHRRYIRYWSWGRIADDLHYSKMQIQRIEQSALNMLHNVIECYTSSVV